jgi:acetyltransferase
VYRAALETLLRDDNVDAVVAIFVPPLGVKQEDVADAIASARAVAPQTPILAVLMGREGLPQGRAELHAAGIPAYLFPESAARALAALNRYRAWLERKPVSAVGLPVDPKRAQAIIERAQKDQRSRLTTIEALDLVAAYGIPIAGSRLAQDADAAVSAAQQLGFPVALKIDSLDIIHKSDVGAVILGLTSETEVRNAFQEVIGNVKRAVPSARVNGVIVQRQEAGGVEIIAGISRDPLFGPLVMFGLGGIFVEALRDVAFRLAPIDTREAQEMVVAIRSAPILFGMRGRAPANLDALADLLRRIAQLAADCPQIAELDLNPVLARATDVLALDARVALTGGRS